MPRRARNEGPLSLDGFSTSARTSRATRSASRTASGALIVMRLASSTAADSSSPGGTRWFTSLRSVCGPGVKKNTAHGAVLRSTAEVVLSSTAQAVQSKTVV